MPYTTDLPDDMDDELFEWDRLNTVMDWIMQRYEPQYDDMEWEHDDHTDK